MRTCAPDPVTRRRACDRQPLGALDGRPRARLEVARLCRRRPRSASQRRLGVGEVMARWTARAPRSTLPVPRDGAAPRVAGHLARRARPTATGRCVPAWRSRTRTWPPASSSPQMTARWAPSFAALSSCLPSLRSPSSARADTPAGAQLGSRPRSRVTVSAGSAPTTTTGDVGHLDGHARRRRAPRTRSRPSPKPMPGRGLAAQQLDQAVVATAAAQRVLLAVADPRDRTRTWCGCSSRDRAPDAARAVPATPTASRWRWTPSKCVRARVAQVVGDERRLRDERLHHGVLGVEQPQRRCGQALPLELRQPVGQRLEVAAQRLDVGGPARPVADGVEPQLHAGQPHLRVEPGGELDDLGVDGRARIADAPRRRTARTGGSARPAAGRSGTSAR